jgi:hypothetical protein
MLNDPDKLSEIPVKRFYRYVLEPELRFKSSDGSVAEIGSRYSDEHLSFVKFYDEFASVLV